MDQLKSNIINYLKYEEQLKNEQQKIKDLKQKKEKYEKNILSLMETYNLKDKKINLNNSFIHYSINETLHPINMDFIEKCLNIYYNDEKETSKICSFIQQQRTLNKKKNISLKKKKLSKKQKEKLLR